MSASRMLREPPSLQHALPQREPVSDEDVEIQIIRELIARQFHRGRELRILFPLDDPLPRSTL